MKDDKQPSRIGEVISVEESLGNPESGQFGYTETTYRLNPEWLIHRFVDFACRVRPLLEETLEAYPLQSERDQFAGREQACLSDLMELLELTKNRHDT